MLIAVSGTRWATIADHALIVRDTILRTADDDGPHTVHVGDARGVDLIVRQTFGRMPGFTVVEYEANWDECAAQCPAGHRRSRKHGRGGDYCPGAGMRRNHAMIDAFVAAGGKTMLAFPAANTRSSGTRGCLRYAREHAGLIVPDDHIIALEVRRG